MALCTCDLLAYEISATLSLLKQFLLAQSASSDFRLRPITYQRWFPRASTNCDSIS